MRYINAAIELNNKPGKNTFRTLDGYQTKFYDTHVIIASQR